MNSVLSSTLLSAKFDAAPRITAFKKSAAARVLVIEKNSKTKRQQNLSNTTANQEKSVKAGCLLREAAANLGQGKLLALRAARLLDPVNRRKIKTIAAHLQEPIAALDEAGHVHCTCKPVILVEAR